MNTGRVITWLAVLALAATAGLTAYGPRADADEGSVGGDPLCEPFEDAYEENDTRETAARVDLPFSATLRSCPVDNDWFSFPVSQGGEIEAEATFEHSFGNIDIYLYDPADELAASSTSATDDEGIIHTAGASGIYSLAVFLIPLGVSGNQYGLDIDASCPPARVFSSSFEDTIKTPVSVPDRDATGVDNCFRVSDTRIINDLNVVLDISHEYVGDLVVALTHETTGTSVTLIDRPGLPGFDPTFGCPGRDVSVVLSDEAAADVEDKCNAGTPAISGALRPDEPLSAFDGESMAGAWTLQVRDVGVRFAGTLDSWALTPTLKVPGDLVGDVNCDGVVNAIDAALVLQLSAGLVGSLACEENADVNGNGAVNSVDAALILQYAAGLIDILPP